MSEKKKAFVGLLVSLGVSFFFIVSGFSEKYSLAMWTIGAFSGLALGKLNEK